MKIALVMPPLYGIDMPPLGLAYIAGRLIKDGHRVRIFCFNSALYNLNEDKRFLWGWDSSAEWGSLEKIKSHFDFDSLLKTWTDSVLDSGPDLIGFSVNTHSRIIAESLAFSIRARKADIPVIFGGPFCSEACFPVDFRREVNVYVRGEGEEAVSLIAKQVESGGSLKELCLGGTVVNTGAGFIDNGPGTRIENPDSIPYPALELFDIGNYTNKEEIPIIFSRGCDYHCRFCTDKPMWGPYRARSAENICAEMERHHRIFGRNKFKCNDLMVNGKPGVLDDLGNLLLSKRHEFYWGGMARARKDVGLQQMRRWKKGGCSYLTYGVESGSSPVLAHMGKPNTEAIAHALFVTSASGIKTNTLWMVGYPMESWPHFLQTLLFLLRYRGRIHEFVSASCCYIPALSWLGMHSRELGIIYGHCGGWRRGGLTPFVRGLRRRILLWFARAIGLYKGGIT